MRFSVVLMALGVAFLAGCSSMLGRNLKEPKVNLARVEVEEMGLKEARLNFVLNVANPNDVDLKVDEVSYKLFLENKEFVSHGLKEGAKVPAKGSSEVSIPVPVAYEKLWPNLLSLFQSKSLAYRIEGDARLSILKIPFSHQGKLELEIPKF